MVFLTIEKINTSCHETLGELKWARLSNGPALQDTEILTDTCEVMNRAERWLVILYFSLTYDPRMILGLATWRDVRVSDDQFPMGQENKSEIKWNTHLWRSSGSAPGRLEFFPRERSIEIISN
jgi:hypothetical protein